MLFRQKLPRDNRVVVVEDDPSIGVVIAAVLSDEGYDPIVVRDGRRALQAVRELRPPIVTLDLELPGIDGRTLLHRLLDGPPEERPRIIVVSASTESLRPEERQLIVCALTKPFDLAELVQAIDDVSDGSIS